VEKEIKIYLKTVKSMCSQLTENELNAFASKLSVLVLKKKDWFIQSGQIQDAVGFITKGLVRSYFIDQDGNEKTFRFYGEGDYATHYTAFLSQKPSKYYFQCLEPTTIVCLSYEAMQWSYTQLPHFERYGRLIAEEILKIQHSRLESFLFQTAEQRYLDFITQRPDIYNRVSLSHLCSYLGIERQTLTRIRQKLAKS
jgi:CRP/FNR family transcriptional regulator, anaerobic regulatory protein